MRKPGPRYRVSVWDAESNNWVQFFKYLKGPFALMQTRVVLRELAKHGYEVSRDSPSIYFERIGWELEYQAPAERLLF